MAFLLHNPNKIPKFAPMKQKKKELMMHEYGKYFLDMSKLVFGGVILTGIMGLSVNSYILFGLGLLTVFVFAVIEFGFYKRSRWKKICL